MARFEIDLEGIGRVPVFKGAARRLSFPFPWRKAPNDLRTGYIVVLPGNKRYHLKRSAKNDWPGENEGDMSRAIFVDEKWVPVESDETIQKIKKAIDEFEKNEP